MAKALPTIAKLVQLLNQLDRLTEQIHAEIAQLANARPTTACEERPFTVARLAAHWGVSEWMVYDMLQDGRLRGFKLGGKLWRISAEEVARCENGDGIPLVDTSSRNVETASRSSRGPTSHPPTIPSAMSKAELRLLCREVRHAD